MRLEPEINLKTLKGAVCKSAVLPGPRGNVKDVEKDVISKQTVPYHS